MTRRRQQRRRRDELLDVEPVGYVIDHARLLGCTCDPPDLQFSGPLRHGEITVVSVAHDPGCPLAPDTHTHRRSTR